MSDKLLPGVIGGLIGFCGAFLLSIVARWREDEKSRSELRSVLHLLISELEDRLRILNNRFADWDSDSAEEYGDLVKTTNRATSGITFNYSEELSPYAVAFEVARPRLASMKPEISAEILRHYTKMTENLLAHQRLLDPPHNDKNAAIDKLNEIREHTGRLGANLKEESKAKRGRNFCKWLWLWLAGKA